MAEHDVIKLFESSPLRIYYDDVAEQWYLCVNDVVGVLTESNDIPQYVKRMRQRDPELNSVWGTICTPHQFTSSDGKKHAVNCASLQAIDHITPKDELPFNKH